MSAGTILATCGGWQPSPWLDREFSPVQRYALDLTGVTGRRITMAFIATAGGDQRFEESNDLAGARAAGVHAEHVRLFGRNQPDLAEAVCGKDLIWVGGGSTANLLAVWRVHGLDVVLRTAWENGVVLAGTSAGALCWHVGGPTSTFGGEQIANITNGLGFIPGSIGVHYDSQPGRRPLLQRGVASGELPAGYGIDEGVAVRYEGTRAVEFVAETDGAAWRVERDGDHAVEERIETRRLPQ